MAGFLEEHVTALARGIADCRLPIEGGNGRKMCNKRPFGALLWLRDAADPTGLR
jgi:hypothetical protein